MTDKELLEKAAKAAGIRAKVGPDGVMRDTTGFDGLANIFSAPRWNPLEDDGDALRLAVRLRMLVDADGEVYTTSTATPKGTGVMEHEDHNGDPCAATRRAIVRAAASLAGD